MACGREVLCTWSDEAVIDSPAVDACAAGRIAPLSQRGNGEAKADERPFKQPGDVPLQYAASRRDRC